MNVYVNKPVALIVVLLHIKRFITFLNSSFEEQFML